MVTIKEHRFLNFALKGCKPHILSTNALFCPVLVPVLRTNRVINNLAHNILNEHFILLSICFCFFVLLHYICFDFLVFSLIFPSPLPSFPPRLFSLSLTLQSSTEHSFNCSSIIRSFQISSLCSNGGVKEDGGSGSPRVTSTKG